MSNKVKKSPTREIEIVDEIEIFESEESEKLHERDKAIKTRGVKSSSKKSSEKKSKDKEKKLAERSVKTLKSRTVRKTLAERSAAASILPAVTSSDIEANTEFHRKRAAILTNIVCADNKQLLSNLFDSSGKVIISAQDFCELVALMISNDRTKVNPSDIVLTLREDFISSCLKIKISPYKKIVSIRINNQDLQDAQKEAYNMLTNTYKISTETVYDDEQTLTSETTTKTKTKTTK